MNLTAGTCEIRPVQSAELDDVLEVYCQCEDFLALGPYAQATLAMVQSDMEMSIAAGGVYCGIYNESGAMVGIVDYIPRPHHGYSAHASITLLILAIPYRNHGLGTQVVHSIEAELAKDPANLSIELAVQVNNPDAIRFWKRQGYGIISEAQLQPDQTTVYMMRKDLIWGYAAATQSTVGQIPHSTAPKRPLVRRWHVLLITCITVIAVVLFSTILKPQTTEPTLSSADQIDAYPLYVMHYAGDTDCAESPTSATPLLNGKPQPWACTLFSAYGDHDHAIAGRNFDWQYSPGLLLFTQPASGYSSVSMVNLGFIRSGGVDLSTLTLTERTRILALAATLPTDGMNERGLAVGMAAVPDSTIPRDPHKPTIGSLCAIRTMLDHASNTDEAVALLARYNIDFTGGPQVHYLVADPSGRSAVVEYIDGVMLVLRSEQPWQLATNFHLSGSSTATQQACWRYSLAQTKLAQAQGVLSPADGMKLLSQVAQTSNDYPTQWSVVYDMSTGAVKVAMGRKYEQVRAFQLPLH